MSTVASDYLGRLLEPVAECLTPEMATRLVNLVPDPEVQAKIDELATRASEGRLTSEERAEYESYVEAIDLIGILQLKARAFLERHSP